MLCSHFFVLLLPNIQSCGLTDELTRSRALFLPVYSSKTPTLTGCRVECGLGAILSPFNILATRRLEAFRQRTFALLLQQLVSILPTYP